MSLIAELKRRNVLRAGALYIGAAWALIQGLAQLFPAFGVPDSVVRWLVIAAVIGFPFFVAFAWFYEFTPGGLKRESEVAPDDSIATHTGKKLNRAIIAVLALAVVLLLTNQFMPRRGANDASASMTPVAPALKAAIPAKSIAVLPLVNESGDQDQQYFSDGLSEDLITALSQFEGLRVISRNSAFQFRDRQDNSKVIGAKLGVTHLLEGSTRRAGNTVRISMQLVNTVDDSTLWSQHYDRPYQDLFALQDEITAAVAGALQAKLLNGGAPGAQDDRPPGGNLKAYTAYLQGNFHAARNTDQDQRATIDDFTRAIRLEPRYAAAHARLSNAWTVLAAQSLAGTEQQQAYAAARAAAGTALGMAPGLALAHVARGYLLLNADFDWTGAEAEFRSALQVAPNNGSALFQLGNLQAALGHPQQAVDLTRQALPVDPLHASWYNWLASYLIPLGRLDEADAAIDKAIELQPAAAAFHTKQAIIAIQRGDSAAALNAAQQEPPGAWRDVALALARQIGPDRAAADAALKHLIETQADAAPYQIAEVYALRRQPDEAFAWLDRALAQRDPGIQYLLTDPFLLAYRRDPRLDAFCRKLGLPSPKQSAGQYLAQVEPGVGARG